MSNRSNRHRPVRRRRYAGLTLVVSLALAILATVGSSPSAAYDKGLRLGDNVSFDDGSAAAGVKIDLFEAVNPWARPPGRRTISPIAAPHSLSGTVCT